MTQHEDPSAPRSHPQDIDARLRVMRQPPICGDAEYHAVTLTADEEGHTRFAVDTRWVGWHDMGRRVEMRQSRIVDMRYGEIWTRMARPFHFVMTFEDLTIFLMAGGHALIERSVAEAAFPELTKPQPAQPSNRSGFVDPRFLPVGADKRAPTPKVRMAVLRRDSRRCRICGRNPDDNVDIVLHVHHIRPWAIGGATEISNLITLCHTCHDGLEPHFDPSLYDYVQPTAGTTPLSLFAAGVKAYRRAVAG